MNRYIPVHHVPISGGSAGDEHFENVSGLDLPPALVFHVRSGVDDRWLTDPVELVRYQRLHPDAEVEVLGTNRLQKH